MALFRFKKTMVIKRAGTEKKFLRLLLSLPESVRSLRGKGKGIELCPCVECQNMPRSTRAAPHRTPFYSWVSGPLSLCRQKLWPTSCGPRGNTFCLLLRDFL